MTIGQYIAKRARMFMGIGVASWLVFAGSLFLAKDAPLPLLHLVGFGGFAGAILCMLFLVKCPRCNGKPGEAGIALGQPFPSKQQVKFCPFCGVNFNEPL